MVAEGSGGGRKRGRLSRSGDFDRVYREGTSHGNRFFVAHSFARPADELEGDTRLGVSVSRKVGEAVDRNAVKRALREAFWNLDLAAPGRDYVLVARPDAAGLVERDGTAGVESALRELLTDSEAGKAA